MMNRTRVLGVGLTAVLLLGACSSGGGGESADADADSDATPSTTTTVVTTTTFDAEAFQAEAEEILRTYFEARGQNDYDAARAASADGSGAAVFMDFTEALAEVVPQSEPPAGGIEFESRLQSVTATTDGRFALEGEVVVTYADGVAITEGDIILADEGSGLRVSEYANVDNGLTTDGQLLSGAGTEAVTDTAGASLAFVVGEFSPGQPFPVESSPEVAYVLRFNTGTHDLDSPAFAMRTSDGTEVPADAIEAPAVGDDEEALMVAFFPAEVAAGGTLVWTLDDTETGETSTLELEIPPFEAAT